jgi:hypothetical protein
LHESHGPFAVSRVGADAYQTRYARLSAPRVNVYDRHRIISRVNVAVCISELHLA